MQELKEMVEGFLDGFSKKERQFAAHQLHGALLREANYNVNGFEDLRVSWPDYIPVSPGGFDFARAHELSRAVIEEEGNDEETGGGLILLTGLAGVLDILPPPPAPMSVSTAQQRSDSESAAADDEPNSNLTGEDAAGAAEPAEDSKEAKDGELAAPNPRPTSASSARK